jgi:general secretion pathway protein N
MRGFFRRPGVRLGILGIAAYLIFLLVNLPASWAGFLLERASRGALALGDTQGTAWKGSGVLGLQSAGTYRRLADIQWNCNPLGALTGKLNLTLSGTARDAQLRAGVTLSTAGASFRSVDATAPAGMVESVFAAAAFAKPEGRLRLQADSLEVGAGRVRGTATVEWLDAGLGGFQAPRLGDYRLQVTGNGERADLRLATLRGDLRLNGQGEWRAAQPRLLQLRGTAEAAAGRKDLEQLMQVLGVRGAGIPQPFAWSVPL